MQDQSEGYMQIGELARRAGISTRTIRYYEEIGLMNTVKRTENGKRIYTQADYQRIRFIQKLKCLGLSLAEMLELEDIYRIHRTNEKVLPRLIELLDEHLARVDNRINQLEQLKKEIQEYRERMVKKLQKLSGSEVK